ncbi:MAG: type II secretion system protein GspE, partial [Alphaproteobacteria bacterium]|nr:type II secretion system protein GspE [Alphaproteobacteria bacterium]
GVTRLLDMGIEPYLLAASLRAVLAQRLVRRLCETCRTSRQISSEERVLLGPGASDISCISTPVGCAACHGTGYAGRLLLSEILAITPTLRQAIIENAGPFKLRALAAIGASSGSLLDSGILALRDRRTSFSEVLNATGADET